jgi:RNA polymerase sigma-70 factor (sigma-E family)
MAEPDDFREFVSSSSPRLLRAACLLTGGDRATADDLVADTLARVYLAWPRIRSDDAFAYARRTLVNRHLDWRRLLRRRAETLTSDVPERAARGSDHSHRVAQRDSLMRSLGRLTRRERAVVVLRFFLDLSEEATAAELGVAVGTVKSTNARALAKLRVSPDLAGVHSAVSHSFRPGGRS